VLGVRPWWHAAVRVLLRDRAASELVVEQRHSGREEAQQLHHLDFGDDEAAAAHASPGQLAQGLTEPS